MPTTVLFLCTGNSARSILAEAILNRLGKGHFHAYSAGSQPKGDVNPNALGLLRDLGYDTTDLRSKSWSEFAEVGAPTFDFIFTVCDNAAGEVCPIWPGQPVSAHWGVEDPADVEGNDEARRKAFLKAFTTLRRRIELFLSLPHAKLDKLALSQRLNTIGKS